MTKKEQVLEVLQYWKSIEFLDQIDLQEENPKLAYSQKTTMARCGFQTDVATKSGVYGAFVGCTGYFKTKCKDTEKIKRNPPSTTPHQRESRKDW